jgi:hypothetical protein
MLKDHIDKFCKTSYTFENNPVIVITCLSVYWPTLAYYLLIINHCLFFCPFSVGHCVVCPSSTYRFWLPIWYRQTLLVLYFVYWLLIIIFFFSGVKPNDKQLTTCAFCGNDYVQSQQRVRLRSRVKLNKKVECLLQKYQTEPGSLGKYQLNLVQNYLNSYNQLVS